MPQVPSYTTEIIFLIQVLQEKCVSVLPLALFKPNSIHPVGLTHIYVYMLSKPFCLTVDKHVLAHPKRITAALCETVCLHGTWGPDGVVDSEIVQICPKTQDGLDTYMDNK